MRLIILSDTHIPDRAKDIPPAVAKELKTADLIVHAGDFTSLECYTKLKSIKPLKAVSGNLDSPEISNLLNEKETFTLSGHKIGLMHGFGSAENVLDFAKKFFNETYDLAIFGHTHNAFNEKIGKTIFFNPGSPTDKIFAAYNSYGIIEIGKLIETKIVRL